MQRRLLLSYMLIILVSTLLFAIINYTTTQQSFAQYNLAHNRAHTELLGTTLSNYYGSHGSWDGVQPDLDQLALTVGTTITISDADGTIVAATERDRIGQSLDLDQAELLQVFAPDGTLIGDVEIGYTRAIEEVSSLFESQLLTRYLFSLIAVISLALLLASLLARSINRPLAELSDAAEEVAHGNYDVRVSVGQQGGQDQLNHLGRVFNSMVAELGSVQRLRRELVANVSHDLRTPLTVMRGYIEGLRTGQIADRRSAEIAFDAMDVEMQHLLGLVDALHGMSQLDGDSAEIARTPVDLTPFVQTEVNRMQPLAAERHIALQTDLPPQPVSVELNPHLMGQALQNLLDNAIAHTPPDGTICVAARVNQNEVTLSVRDSGSGISAEHLPHIFERFYRADAERGRTTGGVGIGLSIVQRVAQLHDGTVEVESDLGRGATFTLRFPAHL